MPTLSTNNHPGAWQPAWPNPTIGLPTTSLGSVTSYVAATNNQDAPIFGILRIVTIYKYLDMCQLCDKQSCMCEDNNSTI